MENYLYYDLNSPERIGPFLEKWMPIKNFENYYLISDYGRINSIRNGILKLNRNKDNYIQINLFGNNIKRRSGVHVLVCETFIPNPENKPCVNHKKGFKQQNFIHELEWATYSENGLHAFRVLKVYTNPNNHMKKSFYVHFNNQSKIVVGIRNTARELGIPYQGIQNILKGKGSYYNGFTFSYHHDKI